MSSSSSKTILTLATVTVLGGLVAYAVYFDYKRRNDVAFRKKLRKDKKRVDRTTAQSREAEEASNQISTEDVRAALDKVKAEEVPSTPEQKEQYFMSQVSMGEQICTQGPEFNLQAALCFYRALRVYPSPVELIVIYQKTVPDDVFKIVMEMTNLDVKNRIEGYYNEFPPKLMNVKVDTVDVPDGNGQTMRKKILVVTKDCNAGEVIYKENPAVAVLDFDLQGKGTHCTHCLRAIQTGMAIKLPSDRLNSVYCSRDCLVNSTSQSQGLLFGLEPPVPLGLSLDMPQQDTVGREAAQTAFVDYINKNAKAVPLLVARFIARQVANETLKLMPNASGTQTPSDIPEAESGGYTMYDHLERLRYLEVKAPEEEIKIVSKVLSSALPGLEQFVTEERHATLLGKMAYNSYGVCFGDGRDDRPLSTERSEDIERTRTPYGTSKQIGSGLYLVSAYASHSCAPSTRPSFSSGTSELHLVANRPLKKGDEITISYVDSTQHADETAADTRRRRRMELARGWRFACSCTLCRSQALENPACADGEPTQRDESRVEEPFIKAETNEGPSASLDP